MVILLLGMVAALTVSAVAADAEKKSGKLYHVVAFKFKDSASKADIKKVEDAFRDLKGKISQIQSLEWGDQCEPRKARQRLHPRVRAHLQDGEGS